ncbi:hypothetical protein [Deinococcus radiophilus]|nr:hypothetical protein [Deinococcus radiophilus]
MSLPSALMPTAALKEFQEAVGEAPPEHPTLPSPELLAFRAGLLREEWQEVEEELEVLAQRLDGASEGASETDPATALAPLAHELTDLLYVAYGTLTQLGVDAEATFAAVHAANMQKMGGPVREDGKLLKPAGWQPADIRAVLERQLQEG